MMLKTKHLAILMFVMAAPGLFAMRAFTGGNTVDFGAVAGNIGLNLPGYLDTTAVVAPPVVTRTSISVSSFNAPGTVDFGGLAVTPSGPAPSAGVVSYTPVLTSAVTSANTVSFGQYNVPLVSNSVAFSGADSGLADLFARLAQQAAAAQGTAVSNNVVFNSSLVSGIQTPAGVPEPSTLALLGIGTLALGLLRRRR
jgi:PEP-CTERM motif